MCVSNVSTLCFTFSPRVKELEIKKKSSVSENFYSPAKSFYETARGEQERKGKIEFTGKLVGIARHGASTKIFKKIFDVNLRNRVSLKSISLTEV